MSVSAGEGGYIRYAPMSREILGSVPYFYGGTKLKQPDFTENIWQSIHAAPAQKKYGRRAQKGTGVRVFQPVFERGKNGQECPFPCLNFRIAIGIGTEK